MRLTLTVILLVLALPATAFADGLAPPFDVTSAPGGYSKTASAVGNAGGAIAWRKAGTRSSVFGVQARLVAPDGSLGSVADLADATTDTRITRVAVDDAGNAYVVWNKKTSTNNTYVAQLRRVGRDGSVGPTIDVSDPAYDASNPRVTVDAGGNATVIWTGFNGQDFAVRSRRVAADGTLGPIRDLSAPGVQASYDNLAETPGGAVAAAWVGNTATDAVAQARTIGADGTLGPVRDLATSSSAMAYADVDIDQSGTATAVWIRYDGTSYRTQIRRLTPGGTLSPTQDLSAPGGDATYPTVAVDPRGDAVALWARVNGTDPVVQAAQVAADGTIGPVRDLSATGNGAAEPPSVGIDDAGNATVTWRASDQSALVRRIAADGSVGATTALDDTSGPNYEMSAAVAPDGSGLFAWARLGDGGSATIRGRQYRLTPASAPGSGTGGGAQGTGNPSGGSTPTTTAPAPPPPAGGPATASLLGGKLAFHGTTATESASCGAPAGDQCTLSLSLTTGAQAARKRHKAKATALATATATIPGGQTAKVTWRLTAAGRKALRKKRSVAAALTGTSRNRAGQATAISGKRTLSRARH